MDNVFELNIEKMTSQGFGLGFQEGKAIFVPFAYPEEIHRIEITEDKKSHAFARSMEIIKKRDERRNPVCPLFQTCGGCQFQDVTYDYQLKIKKEILEESLLRIGKLKTQVNDVIPSEWEFRYRNKGSFQVKNLQMGYCYPGTTKVFFFEECALLDNSIENHVKTLTGDESLNELKNINIRSNIKGEIIDSRTNNAFFIDEYAGLKFIVDINAFFQVNKTIVPKWLEYIRTLILESDRYAVDLYCGIGIIAQAIAGKTAKVSGIEINKRQIKQAEECLKMNGINNVEFISADAENFLEHSGKHIDLLVINPPRVGMSKWLIRDVVDNPVSHIIYSSCNPDTFARDAGRLEEGGFKLVSVQPFDMFPQTHHLELVGNFIFEGE